MHSPCGDQAPIKLVQLALSSDTPTHLACSYSMDINSACMLMVRVLLKQRQHRGLSGDAMCRHHRGARWSGSAPPMLPSGGLPSCPPACHATARCAQILRTSPTSADSCRNRNPRPSPQRSYTVWGMGDSLQTCQRLALSLGDVFIVPEGCMQLCSLTWVFV